ncbi:type IV pilin N-terminal domain-containing protein [Halovenus rubra]|uniref:Type IV pilin N-terminal domain-containing protein n=2 Tax=Halovenus rubra TaxID=869890 RepID=A0ABD5X5Q3_9EURY|nr:type IV pilin N-terminal domain-containing protein [Halovenus rubra]
MDRALSPVIGVITLVALTLLLSMTVLGTVTIDVSEPPPRATFTVSADATTDTVTLSHRGGESLDVSRIDIHVTVDDQPLVYQPPVPFFASDGFKSGPDGAFNTASPNRLRTGQQTSFQLATTNSPLIERGSTVAVQIVVDNTIIFDTKTTAN